MKDGEIKRASMNFPIQGTSASITKYAAILYYRTLLQKNLLFKVYIPNIIHDEIILDCPKEIANEESIVLKQCMEDAGVRFNQTRVPLYAEPCITEFWKH